MKTCHQVLKKPLADIKVEDLRIMINQNVGLNFLIPIALEELSTNILAEGDYYEGDLLTVVLRVNLEYWQANKDQLNNLRTLFVTNSKLLNNFDTTEDINQGWKTALGTTERTKIDACQQTLSAMCQTASLQISVELGRCLAPTETP